MPATAPAPAPTSAAPAPAISAPSSAPPPKSPSVPTPPPAPSPADDQGTFGDTFAELDAIDRGTPPKEAVGARSRERTPAAPAPAAKEDTTDSTTESGKAAGSANPATNEPAKPVKAADLRAAYDGAKQKIKDYETRLSELTTKVKE